MSETVKVRVAVRVNSKGQWAAYGWTDATEDQMKGVTADMMEDTDADLPERIVYVEADVPLPNLIESVVQGRITDA